MLVVFAENPAGSLYIHTSWRAWSCRHENTSWNIKYNKTSYISSSPQLEVTKWQQLSYLRFLYLPSMQLFLQHFHFPSWIIARVLILRAKKLHGELTITHYIYNSCEACNIRDYINVTPQLWWSMTYLL